MIGLLYEVFVLANGSGGNGKGLLNSLLKMMMGVMYFYTASVTTYTEKLKEGANPAIANMHKKRCCITSEPKDTEKLNLGVIKGLTGDAEINARGLYSSNTAVRLMALHILECNKKPSFDGRIDDSIIRRFINLVFRSVFTMDDSKLHLPNHHKANPFYKTPEWQNQNKCALFDFLCQYDYVDLHIPPCVRKATYDYLCENDDFTCWLDQHYTLLAEPESVEDKKSWRKQTIKLRSMCSLYKETFLRVGSREYRKLTQEKFLEKLKENIKYKSIVAERFTENARGRWFVGIEEKYGEDDASDTD
jgi:phage/plasmid-associated DNA primase